MIGAREEDRQYRRGMVLGLTMAEIMLLLIFLLLLILAAKLVFDQKRVDEAVAARIAAEKTLAFLDPILHQFKTGDPSSYNILQEWQKKQEQFAETERQLKEAQSAMDVLEPLKQEKKIDTPAAKAEATRLIKVAQTLERQAQEMAPGVSSEEAIERFQEAAMVGNQALQSGKSSQDLIAGATCQKNLQQCQTNNESLGQQLARAQGTLPSCWLDGMTGKTQFIFTAVLKDDGIYLYDNHVAGREADQAKLPIAPLVFDRAYQSADFVRAGQPIYQWSNTRDPACRFYVLLKDQTSNDKETYKMLKERGVEHVFFTLPIK